VKRALNAVLRRLTGYELRKASSRRRYRPPSSRGRLLTAPVFILCSVRSGSTLLRVLLNSHSQLCAPHEIHLRDIAVEAKSKYIEKALAQVQLDAGQLEYVLWDWILNRELEESGKPILVNKAPNNLFIADRIAECWPDARFVYLLRHPGAIARSRHELRPQDTPERNVSMVLRYGRALEEARGRHPGFVVRYEELAADPARVTQELCGFLGVAWEPGMLEYGRYSHGGYRAGLGDWKDKIKSGTVQPPDEPPSPAQTPPALAELCAAWGYGDGTTATEPLQDAASRASAPR
jgi:hypothetical protein